MDLYKPIDISEVDQLRTEHGNLLKPLNILMVAEILADCMPSLGIQNSRELGRTRHRTISKKYDGVFDGDKQFGVVEPRTITVYPVVAEMSDEPERYRNTYITDVAGGLDPNSHPFGIWLMQFGINAASEDLYYGIFIAKRDASPAKKALHDSFNGWFTIIDTDIASGAISVAYNNLYVGDASITRANAGDYLLDMWRTRHTALRRQSTIMWMSEDVADLYDDWYRDEHDAPPLIDTAGQLFLLGTNGRCRIKRCAAFPAGSERIILTTRENMFYGTDSLSDMKAMKPFPSGNPYKFTAALKYLFGTQFETINEREFAVNDLAAYGSDSGSV